MKQCPNCGAQMADDSRFCTECGKKFPQCNVCPHCGTSVNEGDAFCQSCGKKLEGEVQEETYEQEDSSSKRILPIILGILLALALIGGGWYGYKQYSAHSSEKQAREQFVKDSLAQVKQDSIKLAEQKEKERIEAEKVAKFREQLSFENFLGMLKHYENTSYANKCGLDLLYKDVEQDGEIECVEIVNGYDVEKGSKKEYGGYEIIAKSNHACYFFYELSGSQAARLSFKDEEDAKVFYNKAKNYGLIIDGDTYYIPNKKLPNGKSIYVNEIDYEKIIGTIASPTYDDGWYVVSFGLDG